jgi:NAD(P)-dependent dehydrogenase (short-subunit alcohol dehydrogenase family)
MASTDFKGEDQTPVPNYTSLLDLSGRVFVVFGAGRGIGRQTAHALSQAGATVVCVGRRAEANENVAEEVGGVAMTADATEREDVERLAFNVVDRLGQVNGIVDILGMPRIKALAESTDEDVDWAFAANFRHAFLTSQAFAPVIGRFGGGTMVFVSSTSGFVVSKERSIYGAAKAALQQYIKSSAFEFGKFNIRLNAVAPGLVSTPRVVSNLEPEIFAAAAAAYPLGRIGTPSEIASTILFLASDMSSHINGQTILAEGGMAARSAIFDLSSSRK